MARKPRSDSKLKSLPGQIQAELRDWLVEENVSYAEARKRLKEEHGIRTSIGALNDFYQTFCFGSRFRRAKSLAEDLRSELEKAPEIFDEPALGAISARVFELAASKEADVGELVKLARIMGESAKLSNKQRELELAERRVAILEKKAAAFDAVKKEVGERGGVSEETLARLEKQLKLA